MAYVCVWDLSVYKPDWDVKQMWDYLREGSKAFCFQKEKGEEGKTHWQVRVSLRTRTRLPGVLKLFSELHDGQWSPTANVNSKNFNYQMKRDTRVEGPWTDKEDPVPTLPTLQVRRVEATPRRWQQTVAELIRDRDPEDDRAVNFVWCRDGKSGKGSLCKWLDHKKMGYYMPAFFKLSDILAAAYEHPASCYLFDVPKSQPDVKTNEGEFWMAVELIKDGRVGDPRYKGRSTIRECPDVWVFGNTLPHPGRLSSDRWSVWGLKKREGQDDWSFMPMDSEEVQTAWETQEDQRPTKKRRRDNKN